MHLTSPRRRVVGVKSIVENTDGAAKCGQDSLWPLKAHQLGQLTADLVPLMLVGSGRHQ